MTLRNPKTKIEKRELAKNKWYNQMAQVGTSWSTWNKWYKKKRVFRSTWNKWNKKKGVFRSSWNKWNKDKGSVQLNLSTCSKLSLQGRETFIHFFEFAQKIHEEVWHTSSGLKERVDGLWHTAHDSC